MAGNGAIMLEEIEIDDLERIPVEEVLERLECTRAGLTSEEGAHRLQIFGPNKLEEKKESKILKFLGFTWNPLSWVMEAAAIMAIVMANGNERPPDWQEFVGIVVLLLINSTISFIEENKANNAASALMASLAPKTRVLRDGRWSEQDAAILVPGDIINIKLGDIIPADARLLEGDPLKIDQSALTGESLPVTKNPSDEVFSASTCKQGEIEAVVIATGVHSFFGKAAALLQSTDSTNQVGHFQKVLTAIGNFCICSIFVGIFIEAVVMFGIQRRKYRDGIDNLLVLLIGGIPIAIPTVLSVTMAIGSHRLSQQGAITKRMTAIVEMAGMDVLCIDKTGTLTLNKLTVDRTLIKVFARGIENKHVILYAARPSRTENQDAIDAAIGMLADPKEARAGIREVHFLPFNPVDKRTALTYIDSYGNWHRASKGAPEQILNLCNSKEEVRKEVHAVIDKFAERGLRSLAVAIQEIPEKTKESPGAPWQFIGLLPLFDPSRHDSAETISRALNLGVNVKMISGETKYFTWLGMGTNMYPSCKLEGTIGRTHHINLVRLYSFCYDEGMSALVYEFMENGSLDKFLFAASKEMIEWEKLHVIAVGTAKGIAYLHEDCQQRIIHYDIKPANILLDATFLPKVADFGLAKLCNRDSTHDSVTGFKGTLGYSAPEFFLRNHPITYKCDVYSFGMFLFEIVGRRKNTVINSSESFDWFPKVVLDKYQKGELAELIQSCGIKKEDMEKAERMSIVALWCVQDSPGVRPSMSVVVKMLEGGVEIMPPPKPTHLLFSSIGTNAVKPPNAATGSSSSSEESTSYWYKETTAIMAKYEIQVASS